MSTHNYAVVSAKYDSTLGAKDPKITVIGSVDGFQYPFAAFWSLIQAANLAGGSSAVQSVLAPIMLNTIIISRLVPAIIDQQQPIPQFNVDNPALAAPVFDTNGGWVDCTEALVGTWTA